MMSGIEKINIEEKHKEILKDIESNIEEVFNRSHYYTHKYRGNRLNNINVSLEELADYNTIKIFLQNDQGYIKNTLTVKNRQITDSSVIKKLK